MSELGMRCVVRRALCFGHSMKTCSTITVCCPADRRRIWRIYVLVFAIRQINAYFMPAYMHATLWFLRILRQIFESHRTVVAISIHFNFQQFFRQEWQHRCRLNGKTRSFVRYLFSRRTFADDATLFIPRHASFPCKLLRQSLTQLTTFGANWHGTTQM